MSLFFAVTHLYNIFLICYCFCRLLFLILLKKSGIDKSTEWSTIPVCHSLMCFFNGGNTKGTNFLKILCLIVYGLCKFVLGLILWFLENLWFDDLCEE